DHVAFGRGCRMPVRANIACQWCAEHQRLGILYARLFNAKSRLPYDLVIRGVNPGHRVLFDRRIAKICHPWDTTQTAEQAADDVGRSNRESRPKDGGTMMAYRPKTGHHRAGHPANPAIRDS